MKDPSHPSLYYHLVTGGGTQEPAFALSFLESPPASVQSSAVLGWLPAVTNGAEGSESGLNDFTENSMSNSILNSSESNNFLMFCREVYPSSSFGS